MNARGRTQFAPTAKRTENFTFSVLFHTSCSARYSVLHLSGEWSGGNEPPLCKGRWIAQARRRDCKSKNFIVKQSLSRLRRQLPLHKGAFLYVHLCLVNFPDKHCFCGHKSEVPHEAGLGVAKFFLLDLRAFDFKCFNFFGIVLAVCIFCSEIILKGFQYVNCLSVFYFSFFSFAFFKVYFS